LAVCAIVASIAAVVFGLLWLTAASARDDAESQRDLALDERDAAIDAGIEMNNELQTARDQLAETDPADEAEREELRGEVDRLTAEVDRLTAENEALSSDLDAATAPSTTAAPETTGAPGAAVAPLYRPSVLGPGQEECLGQEVLDELGAVRLIEIVNSEDPGDDEDLVAALENAASACGIDPSAIFG
jgi:hypothetical protein